MSVLGIDVSTKAVDLVWLDDDTDEARWRRIRLEGTNRVQAIRKIVDGMPTHSALEETGIHLVAIEDPMSRFPHVAKALGIITGAVLARIPHDLKVVQITPTEWKRLFTGKAKAPKEEVRATCEALGFWVTPQDACDAYGIGWACRRLVDDHE